MAAEVNKPDFSYQWSSGGSIVAPSNVKIQTGWVAEVPPFQWENYLQNRQDNAILHLFQKGISEWDAASNYYFTTSGVRSYVQGSDGLIYVAVQDSVGQNPTTDVGDTYWKVAFAENSDVLLKSNNLSDLANVVTARTNLGAAPLASPTFTGVPAAPTAGLGTSTTQVATTAFLFNQFTGNQSTLTNGYQRLPGGIILQWGLGVASAAVTTTTFPITFPTACRVVVGSSFNNNGAGTDAFELVSQSAASFQAFCPFAPGNFTWFAIGY